MNKIYKSIILMIFLATTSCESVKSALGGDKMDNSDEFLVEKKNPLAMPPDFDKLPTPGNQEVSPETFSENNEVKDLLNIEGDNSSNSNNNDNSSDLESSIIKKIQ